MIRTPCWWEGPPTRTVAARRRRTTVFTDGLSARAQDPHGEAVLSILDGGRRDLQGPVVWKPSPPRLVQGGRSFGRIEQLVHGVAKRLLQVPSQTPQAAVHAARLVGCVNHLRLQRNRLSPPKAGKRQPYAENAQKSNPRERLHRGIALEMARRRPLG